MADEVKSGSSYWPLFEHMSRTHGLTLLDSEMEDICLMVEKMRGWRSLLENGPKPRILCAVCGVPLARVTYGAYGPHPKIGWQHAVGKSKKFPKSCKTPTPNRTYGPVTHNPQEDAFYEKAEAEASEKGKL